MSEIINKLLQQEEEKQSQTISLIASENITSKNVRKALSSVLTNKYAEGYPGKRYYTGCEFADKIELYCIELVKKIFNANWANVQPHSGSQANQAVFFALLNPGDTILSLSLEEGGHLTHGAKVSSISQQYNIINYHVDANGFIDMNNVEFLAKKYKPKLIITGASAYPRNWDWKKFREIADLNDSYLLADIAHIAGLIAGKTSENPIKYAHVLTSTTHKTLRGPRGGVIFSNSIELGKKIDKALFPGIQGGPLMNTIAAKAIAFEEVLTPEFELYAQNVLKNAQILANTLLNNHARLITSGTDNHLMILDCRSFELSATEAENLLKTAGIFVSASALPGESWLKPSALRIGTPYITTLGITDITEFAQLFTNTLKIKNADNLRTYVQNNTKKLYKNFI